MSSCVIDGWDALFWLIGGVVCELVVIVAVCFLIYVLALGIASFYRRHLS